MASMALTAGAPPWNGMCCTGTLAKNLKKYSASMCEPVPMPAEAKLMVLPFIDLMKAGRSFAGLLGLIDSVSGLDATIATVLRSLAAYCLLFISVSLMAIAVVVARMV